MPLDFNSTKQFRDKLISKTLQVPNGPQTFNATNYQYKTQNEFANRDLGNVVTNRKSDLQIPQNANTFKPLQYNVKEEFDTIPRRANLALYYNGTPYFLPQKHTLVSILSNSNYQNESELFKFAATYIRDKNQKGPVYARIQQNLYKSTVGRVKLIDALQGNLAVATNLLTGKQPLIDYDYSITAPKSILGKGIDFIKTLGGINLPFPEIPGDYLSNPRNPVNVRPEPKKEFGKIFQDVTGALGSLIGIQRRPLKTRKPSDLFIEYMGNGQKQTLFDMLSYSKYAPNYTTTARSQNTSKLFNFVDKFAQGVKNALGVEAPNSEAYIGDDRGNSVMNVLQDFNGRPVQSPYYLSLLFDKTQAELFEKKKNINEGGQISGKLTWISNNSKNKLGINNTEYDAQRSNLEDSLSTKFEFRDGSILGVTQEILNGLPTNGGEARSHVANVIDQTSRIFREGNTLLSRGSAIKYVNKFGQETGAEFCRVWTKDRPYFTYGDTMKKGGNIRKFEGTVVSNPWNLNIAPMSNGKKGFENSTNIFDGYKYGPDKDGKSFYAKKYMFSIENLAWKTSNRKGFTVLDLPYCERGPNGGRVMWFPPYDIKVSENNQASWEANRFLGRPEPIYTYSNTERTGQLSFKIIVDHPSIINLLTREHFVALSDDEADNYIRAVFAGCENLDFYDLIRRYTTLDKSDVENIKAYLNENIQQTTIEKYKVVTQETTKKSPETTTTNTTESNTKLEQSGELILRFDNAQPGVKTDINSQSEYTSLYNSYYARKTDYANRLEASLTSLAAKPLNNPEAKSDRNIIFGTNTTDVTKIPEQKTKINDAFEELKKAYDSFVEKTTTLKNYLSQNKVKNITVNVLTSTSSIDTVEENKRLSLRRSHSIIADFLKRISKDGTTPTVKWFKTDIVIDSSVLPISKDDGFDYKLNELGWTLPDGSDGKLLIKVKCSGESWTSTSAQLSREPDAFGKEFKSEKDLNIYSWTSFMNRKAIINFEYELKEEIPKPINPEEPKAQKKYKVDSDGKITVTKKVDKPPIDVMKRIIMKTLSECYYFKKLEENSPMVFSSLREKLKYFHPGFHSMTPEGLNSRLTFLQQCIRPGDTIPIKGLTDESDLNARNTSFGPPPICVLRIGDFYHSKIIIRDCNFSYENEPWDLNPEGIGMQPMLVSVTLSISFIGGQGLEAPVSRLQNALSSNFFANTEIYDERAIPTNTRIANQDAQVFTERFLRSLLNNPKTEPENLSTGNVLKEGYIGTATVFELDYTELINNLFTVSKKYVDGYKTLYNIIVPKYGQSLSSILLSPVYRDITFYDLWNGDNSFVDISLFGLYKKSVDIGSLYFNVSTKLESDITNSDLCSIIGIDKDVPPQKKDLLNKILTPQVVSIVNEKFGDIVEEKAISDFEKLRNELISAIDPLNFMIKWGMDFQNNQGKYYEVPLTGFTKSDFYNEYASCIDYIEACGAEFYTDLDTSIDFKKPTFTTDNLKTILSVLLKDDVKTLIDFLKTDMRVFDETTINNIENRLKSFITIIPEKTFSFPKFSDRTNTNKIFYFMDVPNYVESTDENLIKEGKKLKSSVVDIENDRLNYYKVKIQ